MALCAVLMLATTGLAGCSAKPVVMGSPAEKQNLLFIAQAYIDAAEGKLGRPPNNAEEFKSFLEEIGRINNRNADDILVSPNDGLPYVIVWGQAPGRYPIAYEQKGKEGKRLVIDSRLMPWSVTDEGFARLRLPPGHKPPSDK
jgi:hypothetical protein